MKLSDQKASMFVILLDIANLSSIDVAPVRTTASNVCEDLIDHILKHQCLIDLLDLYLCDNLKTVFQYSLKLHLFLY